MCVDEVEVEVSSSEGPWRSAIATELRASHGPEGVRRNVRMESETVGAKESNERNESLKGICLVMKER